MIKNFHCNKGFCKLLLIDDAKHALCFSSGMAAANAMLEATLGLNNVSGDHVVAIRQVNI